MENARYEGTFFFAKCKLAIVVVAIFRQSKMPRPRQWARAKGLQHVNWCAGSTCGILAAYRWLRRVNGEASGVLELTFGVDWRSRRAKRGRTKSQKSFRRFIPACGSYLAEAVQRWKKPDMAVGQLLREEGEEEEEEEGRDIQNQRRGRSSLHCCTES